MMRWHRILLDSKNDNGSESGYGTETPTPATTTETSQTKGDTDNGTKADTSSEGTKDTTAAGSDKSQQTSTEDVTGYTGKDDKTEETQLELDLKGLEEASVSDIKEFAKTHGLTKEQAQAMVDKRKSDADAKIAAKEAYIVEEAKVFEKWETELKSDAEFGGDNFAHSVHNVNKLIREELPGLKNLLTTSGKRLPPSVMKDLNKVARRLYGETEFVQGDKASTKEAWNPLDFYKQKT